MATIELSIEQVTFEADELCKKGSLSKETDEDCIYKVVDPNTDFENYCLSDASTTSNFREETGYFKPDETSKQTVSVKRRNSDLELKQDNNVKLYENHHPRVHRKQGPALQLNDSQNVPTDSKSLLMKMRKGGGANDDDLDDRSPKSAAAASKLGAPGSAQSQLKYLTNSCDALALQESVIGKKRVEPASPDVVAQVIASVHSRVGTLSVPNSPTSSQSSRLPVAGSEISQQYHHTQTQPDMDADFSNVDASSQVGGRELHRFPQERIVMVTEKRPSWFSPAGLPQQQQQFSVEGRGINSQQQQQQTPRRNGGKLSKEKRKSRNNTLTSSSSQCSSVSYQNDVLLPQDNGEHLLSSTVVDDSSVSSSKFPKDLNATGNKQELVTTPQLPFSSDPSKIYSYNNSEHDSNFAHSPSYKDASLPSGGEGGRGDVIPAGHHLHHRHRRSFDDGKSVRSDSESVYSSDNYRYELESNCSEILETQSNFSDMSSVSEIEEEMFRIRKLLLELPPTSQHDSRHPDIRRQSVLLGRTAGIVVPDVIEGPSRAVVDQEVFFEVQRQKANLEGQLETLRVEAEEAAHERVRLQSQLASCQALLKSKNLESKMDEGEKENLIAKVKEMQENNRHAESVIGHLRSSVDSKLVEIANLKEELKEVEESNARLRIDTEEIKVDLDGKESAVQGLKSKMAELHVLVQLSEQEKTKSENEARSLRADLESCRKSRDWYQQQLHATQDSRSKLQQDFISVQAARAAAANQVENLTAEIQLLQRNLTELQQRAMKEKEVLMRHLETIEADMLEREAAFEHIQKNKGQAEEEIYEKFRKVQEEKSKFANSVFQVAELERQLESVRKEIAAKDSAFTVIDKERAELMNRTIVAQKAVQERDLSLHASTEKCFNLEQKVQSLQMEVDAKDEQLRTLKLEKNSVDLALNSAVKEKKEVDDALSELQANLKKLDSNLQRIKADLASKTALVELVTREKQKLEEDFVAAEQKSLALQQNYESYGSDIASRDKALENLRHENEALGQQLLEVRTTLDSKLKDLEETSTLKQNLAAEIFKIKQGSEETLDRFRKDFYDERQMLVLRIKDLETDLEAMTIRHKRVNDALESANRMRKQSEEIGKTEEESNRKSGEIRRKSGSWRKSESPVDDDDDEKTAMTPTTPTRAANMTLSEIFPRERRNSLDLSDGTRILRDLSNPDKEDSNDDDPGLKLMRQMRQAFEEEMVTIRAELDESEDRAERYLYEKRELEEKISRLERENERLELSSTMTSSPFSGPDLLVNSQDNNTNNKMEEKIKSQLEIYRTKMEELTHVLKLCGGQSSGKVEAEADSRDADTQTDNVSFMRHVLEQDNDSTDDVARLEAAVLTMEAEQKERQRVYESNVKVLTRKLKEVMKAKKKLEVELAEVKVALTSATQQNKSLVNDVPNGQQMLDKTPVTPPVSPSVDAVPSASEVLPPSSGKRPPKDPRKELLHYKAKVKDLQLKLAEVQESFESMKKKAEANEQLALELEKEKGRLTGVNHANVVLKQQTSNLEAALVERETVVTEMGLTTRDLTHRREEEAEQVKERIRDLEVALTAEQETCKELRRQVFSAKRESGGLRKQVSSLRGGVDSANQLAEVKKTELSVVQAELERRNSLEVKLRSQLDSSNLSLRNCTGEIETLKQRVVENETKDSLLAEQLKSLSWHLRQKNEENSALNEKLRLIEKRNKSELESLEKMLQETRIELEKVKQELEATMKDKFLYQSQSTELRNALKTSLEQNKHLRLQNADGLKDLKVPESPQPYDESAIVALLQKCAVMPESRPLNNLKTCLNTLKQEMENLQKQLQENVASPSSS